MSDDLPVLQDILSILRGILIVMSRIDIERKVLLARLQEKGVFNPDELKQMEQAVAERMAPTVAALEKAHAEGLLTLLRKFQGPAQ